MINLRTYKFRLRISKRVFRVIAWLMLTVATGAGLRAIGMAVTPLADDGSPMLLVPSLWTTEQ